MVTPPMCYNHPVACQPRWSWQARWEASRLQQAGNPGSNPGGRPFRCSCACHGCVVCSYLHLHAEAIMPLRLVGICVQTCHIYGTSLKVTSLDADTYQAQGHNGLSMEEQV